MEKTDPTTEAVSYIIGAGIHRALRKYADSKHAGIAWRAIDKMPDSEWSNIVIGVSKDVVDYLNSQKPV